MLGLQRVRINNRVWLMKCSNCEKPMTAATTAITVCGDPRGAVIGDLCSDCVKGVLTMKLVFKREKPDEPFKFEQYLPVENVKT